MVEKVRGPDARFQDMYTSLYNDFKEKNIGKFRTAGYFLELARIIEKRKLLETN